MQPGRVRDPGAGPPRGPPALRRHVQHQVRRNGLHEGTRIRLLLTHHTFHRYSIIIDDDIKKPQHINENIIPAVFRIMYVWKRQQKKRGRCRSNRNMEENNQTIGQGITNKIYLKNPLYYNKISK